MIREDCEIHETAIIWQPDLVNLLGCSIGEETSVGAFVEIGKGVVIGKRCSIGAFSFIPQGIIIGDDVFIAPRVTFLNDKYPPSPKPFVPDRTIVRDGVVIGGGALILPGVIIGMKAKIAAGAVVTRDVPSKSTIAGFPANGFRSRQWSVANSR